MVGPSPEEEIVSHFKVIARLLIITIYSNLSTVGAVCFLLKLCSIAAVLLCCLLLGELHTNDPTMSKHTEDEMAEFQETFHLFDTRGDGKIYASQLADVLRALSQNPTEQEIRKCGFTQNPDARISFEMFYPIVQTVGKNRVLPTLEDFIEGFRVFDKDQNGLIGSADLRHVLTNLGDKMSDDEVSELLVGQEDTQGNVPYEEFIKMVLNG